MTGVESADPGRVDERQAALEDRFGQPDLDELDVAPAALDPATSCAHSAIAARIDRLDDPLVAVPPVDHRRSPYRRSGRP